MSEFANERIVEIEALIDGDNGGEIGYLAKGDHTVAEMEAAIRYYAETQHGPGEPLTGYEFNPQRHAVETRHYRWIPAPPDWGVARWLEPSNPGRGAFVATVVWL